jgi:hypothetical protein
VLLEQVDAALHGVTQLARLLVERGRPATLGAELATVGGLIFLTGMMQRIRRRRR